MFRAEATGEPAVEVSGFCCSSLTLWEYSRARTDLIQRGAVARNLRFPLRRPGTIHFWKIKLSGQNARRSSSFRYTTNHKFGIEIRNRVWLNAEFANLLRHHQIAFVLQDRSWMPNPLELQFDPITADWTYIRWLGDRKQIEAQNMTWDKAVFDRTTELSSWVDFCYQMMKRGVLIYAYANNHFQGYGPATISKFLQLWAANGFGKIAIPERGRQQQATLFPSLD
jgi:Protein of unknown function DUF72